MGPRLHPALESWFSGRFSALSEVQRLALPYTLSGENTLILAPTGSGKTLAAFLSVLSELAGIAGRGELPNAVCAVYVSPLKALDNDIHRNLEEPLAAINDPLPPARRVRMEVRTGDTELPERGRQQRRRPHLLLTTPESLSSLLSQKGWSDGFSPRIAVVDEIHAFAESKRGSLLALTLERLEARAPGPVQRIGLSATAWPVETAQRFLCGERACAVAALDVRRAHRLEIAVSEDQDLPPAGHSPYRIAHVVAGLAARERCTLVFTSTRSAAERLGLALQILMPEFEDRIAVHHGSVDRERRLRIEAKLAAGELKVVVSSTSLELGVDYESVDQVLLVGAPRGVSRALQRLGRSGHRVDGIAAGALVPLSLPDLLECIALREAAHAGRLDRLRVPQAPLDVLAQVLLGMSIERPWSPDEACALLKRAGPYLQLARADFDAVLEFLAGGGAVLGPYGTYGKIVFQDGSFRVASREVARSYYLNIGTISDDVRVRVVTRTNRKLGEVEESFLTSLQPGEAFVIGGKAVALSRVHQNIAVVEPAKGERVKTPRWLGGRMPLTARLAEEERELRRSLRQAFEKGGEEECRRTLEVRWGAGPHAARMAARFAARQNEAAAIPVDSPVLVERFPSGRRGPARPFSVRPAAVCVRKCRGAAGAGPRTRARRPDRLSLRRAGCRRGACPPERAEPMSRTVELAPGMFAHASGALWLAGSGVLVLADVHLGYAWAQRRRGSLGPLVEGGAAARLQDVVREFAPGTIVFLGDLVHAPKPGPPERAEIEETLRPLAERAALIAVRGNHDRAFARDFAGLGIATVDEWTGHGITAVHGDRPVYRGRALLVLGHLHPSLCLADAAGAARRFPVFLKGPHALVLPAFSPFAAGYSIRSTIPAKWRPLLGEGPFEAVVASGTRAIRIPRLFSYGMR